MEWVTLFDIENSPSAQQISEYIANPLWENLNSFIVDNYQIKPTYSYSRCSGQPGWNVKYKKAGCSLCTLYPMEGFFIALVVIGDKEQTETELLLPMLGKHVQQLYANADYVMNCRWLMINVTDEHVLEDVKQLIQIRRKIKSTK